VPLRASGAASTLTTPEMICHSAVPLHRSGGRSFPRRRGALDPGKTANNQNTYGPKRASTTRAARWRPEGANHNGIATPMSPTYPRGETTYSHCLTGGLRATVSVGCKLRGVPQLAGANRPDVHHATSFGRCTAPGKNSKSTSETQARALPRPNRPRSKVRAHLVRSGR